MCMKSHYYLPLSLFFLFSSLFFISCGDSYPDDILVFTNASIWDGTQSAVHENSALITYQGNVLEIIGMNDPDFPEDAVTVDLDGRYIIPGLINAHGHVGMARGLETGQDVRTRDNVIDQLRLYAAYGITTVVSLGDEPEAAFGVRNEENFPGQQMARLYLAGPVLNPASPDEARSDVADLMENSPDWTKIRVDDGLGTREKMSPDVYSAIIEESHAHDTPLAAHIVALEDAKRILQNNGDLIAHSVRDEPVDRELIDLMLERDICITPTLTREISTYIYAEEPDFFDDPFFLEKANPDVLEQLRDPEAQDRFTGEAAEYYRDALPLAKENMMSLHNSGIRVALGTDSGPPARFQGYFEHMEMEMMQEAGMTPAEVLLSATAYAAECMRIDEKVGTLEEDKAADFVVLENDPLANIRNLRDIHSVYIGAQRVDDVVN
ncbi:amidohydrolase family protein [soil metagenome]